MMRTALMILCCFAGPLAAQVAVDRAIELVGPTSADRQVLGLPPSLDAADALAAGVSQSGAHKYVLPASGSAWTLSLPGSDGPPIPGMHIMLQVPAGASTTNTLAINSFGPYPVVLDASPELDSTLTVVGTLLSLVFDGTSFQVMNGTLRVLEPCPAEMVEAFGSYCIDRTETPAVNFLNAALQCAADGKRLCSWGEFHAACAERVELGLVGMTGNWEWTATSSDSDQFIRVAGGTDCEQVQRINGITNMRAFRCCFTR